MKFLDIYAVGGTNFNARLIEDYDAGQSPSAQPAKDLGSFEFGSIDEGGQYVGDDDEVIESARAEYDICEEITAGVR